MKKNTLYTVTKGNRPAFMPDINVFAIGGLTNSWQPSNARMESWTDSWIQKQKSKAYDAGDVNGYNSWIDLQGTPGAVDAYKSSKNVFGISKQANPFSKMNIGSTLTSVGLGAASAASGLVANALNDGFSGIGDAFKGMPGLDIIGAGLNRVFGSKRNEENISDVESNIAGMENSGRMLSSSTTSNDVVSRFNDLDLGYDFNKSYIGKDGLWSNKIGRLYNKLKDRQETARAYALHGLMTGAENADQYLDDNVMANFASYGGPMNPYGGALGLMQNDNYINAINNRSAAIMKANPFNTPSNAFGDGGGIHISPSKRGTFTAAASKHNMGVQEFARKVLANKDDYSPAMVKKANFARNASKWHAFGGELGTNGTDWTNGLLWVDAGGSHQQNPLGGVPVGFDANGTPNFVEEGETIWNDYVFSDRIKVPKAMFHTLGLGGAMKKGITFADASKKLSKESEQRPNDPISMAGLDASLAKLAAVQEAERIKKQMRESTGLGNVAAYGGPVNTFEGGGKVEEAYYKWFGDNVYGRDLSTKQVRRAYKVITGEDAPEQRDIWDLIKEAFYNNPSMFKPHFDWATYSWVDPQESPSFYDFENLSTKETKVEQEPVLPYNIPRDIAGNYTETLNWLKKNYKTASEEELRGAAREGSQNMAAEYKKKASIDWLSKNKGLSKEVASKVANAMISSYGDHLGGRYNPETAFNALIPTLWMSDSNFESSLRKLLDNGVDFENALNIVNTHYPNDERQKAQFDRRMRETYANYAPQAALPIIQANAVHDDNSRAEQVEQGSSAILPDASILSSPIDSYALRDMAIQAQSPTYANQQSLSQTITTPRAGYYSGASDSNGSGRRGSTGLLKYDRYLNGSDGVSIPTGFTVDANGKVTRYTPEYEEKARKLTADDVRNWVAAHPDDVSYQSFRSRGNNLNALTDFQASNGALDGDYGFLHHVVDSMLQEENAAKAAKTAPGAPTPLERTPGGTAIAEPLKKPEQPKNLDIKYTGLEQEPYQPLGTGLRYSPAVGNAMAVLSDIFNKPDYTYPDRLEAVANAAGNAPVVNPQPIGDYMRYTPFDRMFYANQLQANSRATDRALGNTASPSAAAGLLANAVNTNNALGNLYRQAEEYNLAQRQQVKDFNRRTNMFNSQMGLEAAMANAKNRLAARNLQMQGLAQVAALRDSIDQQYSAARSANLTNLFNSLGNIGRENFIFNQINDDKSRSYRTRRNGTSYYDLLEEAAKKACGGKMKRK